MRNNSSDGFPKEVKNIEEAKQLLKKNSQAVKVAVDQMTKQRESANKANNKK